ncbi:MAG: hypothetical protein HOY79_00480 [Streptomyces sp.]|nr:hypothetical protein [Streptomyces sp.]
MTQRASSQGSTGADGERLAVVAVPLEQAADLLQEDAHLVSADLQEMGRG